MSSKQPSNNHGILIAEYTLGLLDRHDMAKAHQLLSQDDDAITAALNWENSLLELTDLLPPVDPSPLLLQRIQSTLGHQAIPSPSSLYRQPASLRPKDDDSIAFDAAPDSSHTKSAGNVTPLKRSPTQQEHLSGSHPAPVAPLPPLSNSASATVPNASALPNGAGPTTAAPNNLNPSSQTPASTKADDTAARHTRNNLTNKLFGKHHSRRSASPTNKENGSPANRPHTAEHTFSAMGEPTGVHSDTAGYGSQGRSTQTPDSSPSPHQARANSWAASAQSQSPATPESKPSNTAALPNAIPITPPSSTNRAQQARLINSVWTWRAMTLVFAALALAVSIIPSTPSEPPVTIVRVAPTQAAILQAPGQSSTPAWLVTFDAQRNVYMAPQVHTDVAAGSSVQLWTYNETLPQPRSLGLVDPNKPITIPATLMGELGKDQFFEMTLEPEKGSPTASPSGPVLFIGRVVTFGVPQSTDSPPPVGAPPAS